MIKDTFRTSAPTQTAVLLVNLGGPEKLADVKPFLYNLFSDPEIIRLPIRALQKPLAWFIATTRRKKSEGYYRQIGGGSPQRRITSEQAAALFTELEHQGCPAHVYVGMACWHPLLLDVLNTITQDSIKHLIILPLFPHFSLTTTGSAAKKIVAFFDSQGGLRNIRRSYITHYEEEPLYISALTEMILNEMGKFPNQNPQGITLLFSAHSIPEKYVQRGDPYLKQTQKTVQSILNSIKAKLGIEPPNFLSFQSKVGPVKWLSPSTENIIREFGKQKVQQVLVIPISFVSEHIETLYEIDILYKKLAEEVKLPNFRRVPALNCHPSFIQGLASLVKERINTV